MILEGKFCHVCGRTSETEDLVKKRSCTTSATAQSDKPGTSALSFDVYRERKEKERSSRFKSKKAKAESNDKKPSEVTIQIGLIKCRDDDLKVVRGCTLPLKIMPTTGADELLKKGAEKMIKFNKDLTCSPTGFTLLYPDRTEVRTVPGSVEPFTLQRYKEELGKAYGRLTLYLCKIDEFVDSSCRSYCSGESECGTTYFPDLNEVSYVYLFTTLLLFTVIKLCKNTCSSRHTSISR